MILNTDNGRLRLRHFRKEDLADLFDCCRNPSLGDNAGWKPHATIEESEEILDKMFVGAEDMWAVTETQEDRVIGSMGIIPDPRRDNPHAKMLGYWIREEKWRRGYATEASRAVLKYGFLNPAIHLISAYCYPENERSKRVLEKLGFKYEGILHQAEVAYDGRVFDNLCYYITKEDYDRMNDPAERRVVL